MEIGFAMCGSFCTYAQIFPIMEELTAQHHVIPIFSQISFTTDSRFGTAAEHIARTAAICGQQPLHTIAQVEPIGPRKLLDALIIAPCTGNTWQNWLTALPTVRLPWLSKVICATVVRCWWPYPPTMPWPVPRKTSEN